jgi:tripartite-type tricarboxylate transporter receptor subunit TctC
MIRHVLSGVLVALSALAQVSDSAAQAYPDRPIKVIVPYGPGGTDVQMRLAAPFMSKILGQPIVVENKAGGGATLGTTFVRNSPPDGYTLLFTGTSAVSVVPQMKTVSYTMDDFVPIGTLTGTALIVVSRTDAPFKTMAELIAYARANPGKINLGSSGVGTTTHMIAEALQLTAGIRFTHIPHTGMGQVVAAMMNGSADMMIGVPSAFMANVQAGKLLGLASLGTARSEFLSAAPTIREVGYDVVEVTKFGLLAPKGIPAEVHRKLSDALRNAVQSAEYVDRMRSNFVTALYLGPEDFGKALREEERYWGELLKRPELSSLKEK